ncbi:MAG: dephospho-CoA kinase [Deltaproteobacteria bacterium]|jgi:23S rRNA pseudouridine1911/1915/1917 synthase|nr:dephospho-CoA kinase [Deltaproteobacteria bacterium]
MEARCFEVKTEEAGQRLDFFLSRRLAGALSRAKIKRHILEGLARLNGLAQDRPDRLLQAGERVEILLALTPAPPGAEPGELPVLYQDEDLAVLNKPAGLSVHPSPGEPSGTLVNRLLARFPSLRAQEGERPGIVHRLDKDTSGLLLAALREDSRLALSAAFAARLPRKEYLALVYGVPSPGAGVIDAPLGRHSRQKTKMTVRPKDGRPARSDYRVLHAEPRGRFSLLAVRIHTGRTHQIRVHLAHIGHPVMGDARYADPQTAARALGGQAGAERDDFWRAPASRQLLHAWKLAFPHPCRRDAAGGPLELSFVCPPPEDFIEAALALSARTRRLILTGNPGCGKSSALRLLRERGVPVWSADQAVARLYAPGADGWLLLRRRFGMRFMAEAPGLAPPPIDKKALFAAMCAEPGLRREVERLIHPLVQADMRLFFQGLERLSPPCPLAAAEIPLHFEGAPHAADSGADERPLVAGVHCPLEIRAARLRQNRSWSEAMIARMESWQWPEEKKMAAADFVLDNSGPPDKLALEVDGLLRLLEEKRLQSRAGLEQTLRGLMQG